MASKNINENNKINEIEECFVIMPISDQDGYEIGHFNKVYEDIFKPAIEKAGFKAFRVDDSKSSNVIHVNIIKRLIEAPMAICDLSTKNPNVMYELGIRQAFDRPVVLVGDNNPGEIFDINGINTHQYSKTLLYREVIRDQIKISEMIKETYKSHKDGSELNSLISIIKMNAATINTDKQLNESDLMKVIYNEVINIKSDVIKLKNKNYVNVREDISSLGIVKSEELERIDIFKELLDEFISIKSINEQSDYKLKACRELMIKTNHILNKRDISESQKSRLRTLKEEIRLYQREIRLYMEKTQDESLFIPTMI